MVKIFTGETSLPSPSNIKRPGNGGSSIVKVTAAIIVFVVVVASLRMNKFTYELNNTIKLQVGQDLLQNSSLVVISPNEKQTSAEDAKDVALRMTSSSLRKSSSENVQSERSNEVLDDTDNVVDKPSNDLTNGSPRQINLENGNGDAVRSDNEQDAVVGSSTASDYLPRTFAPPGQRRLYIDLGANCGNTYYRAKNRVQGTTRETLKLPSPDVWEVYLWECNPQLINWYLLTLVENEGGPDRIKLIQAAASTSDGMAQFHLTAGQESMTKDTAPNSECDPNSVYQPGGASSLFGSAKRASKNKDGILNVTTKSFLKWHKGLNLMAGDIVHIKFDIEGAELDIIEEFLNDPTNQMCYWNVFWNEYHKDIFVKNTTEYFQHEEFEKTFPKRFQEKCENKKLTPNSPLRHL